MAARPCALHTCHTRRAVQGWPNPRSPGEGNRPHTNRAWRGQVGSKWVLIAAVFPFSGLSRKQTSDKGTGLLMGFPCQGLLVPHFLCLPPSFAEVEPRVCLQFGNAEWPFVTAAQTKCYKGRICDLLGVKYHNKRVFTSLINP